MAATLAMLAALPSSLAATAAAPPTAAPAADPAVLAAVRQQCIGAARETQERERAIAALQHKIDLLTRDAAGRERDIDGSRPEQARLLGALEFLARNLDNPGVAAALSPLDRSRGELLIDATMPGMRAEARALAGEITRIASLKKEAATDRAEFGKLQTALAADGARLAQLVAQRLQLMRPLLPPEPADAAAKLAQGAKTLDDVIRLADAAADRRDQQLTGRVRTAGHAAKVDAAVPDTFDPTYPSGLHAFDPPQSALTPPVSGPITQQFGATDAPDTAKNGLGFTALSAAEVVAPFDGRIVYAGPLRDLGLVLIIQQGRLYHFVLAGLGRIDGVAGEWVLAGEPVGTMPVAADGGSGQPLYFEVRRESRPVDPQPWLAPGDDGHGAQNGDQKVGQ